MTNSATYASYNVNVSDGEVLLKYVIYLDVVWAQNTILDMILLFFLAKCRKGKVKNWGRIITGGVAGGFFSTAYYGIPLFRKYQILYELLSCFGMIFLAIPHRGYYKKQIKEICVESCMLHAILFLISGIWNWIAHQKIYLKNSFLVCVLLTWIIGNVAVVWLNQMKRVRLDKCHVRLFYANKVVEADAIIDTGNSLREPISGNSVSVIERNAMEPILKEKAGKTDVCIIPYHSIGRRGILYGIKLTKMEIVKGEETIVKDNPVVAVYKGTLNLGKGCQMILNPDILLKSL